MTERLTRIALILCLALCLVWPAACSRAPEDQPRAVCKDPLGCLELAPGEPMRLGVIQSLSGLVAPLGLEQVRGLELALARRGYAVFGHTVQLQLEDTGCDPRGGAEAAARILAEPKTAAVFGTTCSSDAATAAEVLSAAGLSMVSGNNSAPFLTSINGTRAPKWQPGYLRTAPNEESAGPAAARFAYERLGLRRAAVVNDGDIYTRGLSDGFAREFRRLGGQVVLDAGVSRGADDMRPVLRQAVAANAQILFFPLFLPEGSRLLLQARKMPGFEEITLMSGGSLIERSFLDAVGAAGVGMFFVGPTPPARTPELERLSQEYAARFGTPPFTSYYLHAFDAANLLLDALEKASIRQPDGGLSLGRQALRDALYATSGLAGVTGALTCDPFGDCGVQRFDILRLDNLDAGIEGLLANVVATYAK